MYIRRKEDDEVIELNERRLFELVERLECKLKKIETIANHALLNAQMSHSLIVIRKVSEDNIDKLDDILD